jgi:hypothetical protein
MKGVLISCVMIVLLTVLGGCRHPAEQGWHVPPVSDLDRVHALTFTSIDMVQGLYTRSVKQPLKLEIDRERGALSVEGWAVDGKARDVGAGVYVDIDSTSYPAMYGFDRIDVANGAKIPAYRYCGFKTTIPIAEIKPGRHTISVRLVSHDGKGIYDPDSHQSFHFELP